MKEVQLIFPSNAKMAEFVLREKVHYAEANSREQMLTAIMPENKIVAAETLYGAILKKMTPKN